jgi:hypothetical protein
VPPDDFGKRAWVPLIHVKASEDPLLSTAAGLAQLKPTAVNKLIGGPSPLAALLAGGLLGGGLGYGVGALGSTLFPKKLFERKKIRRNAALAGMAAGTLPALLWGIASQQAHPEHAKLGPRTWLSSWPFRAEDMLPQVQPDLQKASQIVPPQWYGQQPQQAGFMIRERQPAINVGPFGQMVQADPYTPTAVQRATVDLLSAASAHAGSPIITPHDVAAISASAARGYTIGKVLGALAGLRPEAQQRLQEEGIWAAMLERTVPHAFVPGLLARYGG